MASSALYVVLIAALVLSIGESRILTDGASNGQYIPQRCINNTRTTVTCELANKTNATLLPHPDDCELFYYCVSPDQPPICLQCPAQLHFNRKELVCDYAEFAGCQN